jgi:hypothetical protein
MLTSYEELSPALVSGQCRLPSYVGDYAKQARIFK